MPETFTLSDAKQRLAEEECVQHGHTTSGAYQFGHADPIQFICDRCGRQWSVVSSEQLKAFNAWRREQVTT